MSFFALSHPISGPTLDEGDSASSPDDRVFESKEAALKALKTFKSSRLKTFLTREEAIQFASDTTEILNLQTINITSNDNTENRATEGCVHKSLTPQELKELKQSIEKDDIESFDKLIRSNPRYLMTPCDTPSVIHSGTRSNALHVSAKTGSVKMTQAILEAVQDPDLMLRMYPDESNEARAKRTEFLFDMYLNTPKKGDFDTPLHQASKYGHHDVVKLLASFSSCDTHRLNKEGKTPAEEACSRMSPPIDSDIKKRIISILSKHLYIPVYRTLDYSLPPYVGDLWSPCPVGNSLSFQPANNVSGSPFNTPKSPYLGSPLLLSNSDSKPVSPRLVLGGSAGINSSPLKSPLAIRALLGPLSPQDAEQIQQEWRKSSGPSKSIRLTDPNKGLEIEGRSIAKKYNTGILEFWDFLDNYADLSTPQGLDMLERHLVTKLEEQSAEDALKLLDLEEHLAGLKINDNNASFTSPITLNQKGSSLFAENNKQINFENVQSWSGLQDGPSHDQQSSPLSRSFVWDQIREQKDLSINDSEQSEMSLRNTWDNSLSRSPAASSTSSYHSAASSFNESMATAEGDSIVYLNGPVPTLSDHQVYKALQDVEIDPFVYPNVFSWLQLVRAHSEEERHKWKESKKILKQFEAARKLDFENEF